MSVASGALLVFLSLIEPAQAAPVEGEKTLNVQPGVETPGAWPQSSVVAETSAATEKEIAQLIEKQGWLVALVSLFFVGLALNLTPCVYPMVPITVAYFSRQREGKVAVLLRAMLYVLGIAISYSALGVIAALTGRMFGEQLQSPWVLAGIALLLVALALSQFGLYQVRLPSFLLQPVGGARGVGLLAALVMGLVVGLIAAPCVAPVTLALLLFVGSTGSAWIGFWMFFVLALGLGAPYVALAMFSGTLNKLPKSGAWLLWVERLFGFLLLGLALYFVAPLLSAQAVRWTVFFLAASAGLYLGWLEPSRGGRTLFWLKKAVGVACLAIGVAAVVPRSPPAEEIAWQPYTPAVLEQARNDGRPVIVDFYADWCPPCQEMERTTYVNARVIEVSKSFVMVKVDLTHETPETQRAMEQFEVVGVATLVFLDRQGTEVEELRAVGYVGPEKFLKKVQHVLAAA